MREPHPAPQRAPPRPTEIVGSAGQRALRLPRELVETEADTRAAQIDRDQRVVSREQQEGQRGGDHRDRRAAASPVRSAVRTAIDPDERRNVPPRSS
ncbi:hypothetical protein K7957_03690 [Sphingomonas yunnanensis]|uniref:hypothetical protein n=1 Tax=Sphingomonas yunnanensis TaxID=310400 RepID=UPI001CA67A98|nr:hypothetical protein [Sphingomonas yunnanensis]MBY9062031.1 hypothetical protein [Sphingomonas yunnanensis]